MLVLNAEVYFSHEGGSRKPHVQSKVILPGDRFIASANTGCPSPCYLVPIFLVLWQNVWSAMLWVSEYSRPILFAVSGFKKSLHLMYRPIPTLTWTPVSFILLFGIQDNDIAHRRPLNLSPLANGCASRQPFPQVWNRRIWFQALGTEREHHDRMLKFIIQHATKGGEGGGCDMLKWQFILYLPSAGKAAINTVLSD